MRISLQKCCGRRVKTKKMNAALFRMTEPVVLIPLQVWQTVTVGWYNEDYLPEMFDKLLWNRPKCEMRGILLLYNTLVLHIMVGFFTWIWSTPGPPSPYTSEHALNDFLMFHKNKISLRGNSVVYLRNGLFGYNFINSLKRWTKFRKYRPYFFG